MPCRNAHRACHSLHVMYYFLYNANSYFLYVGNDTVSSVCYLSALDITSQSDWFSSGDMRGDKMLVEKETLLLTSFRILCFSSVHVTK